MDQASDIFEKLALAGNFNATHLNYIIDVLLEYFSHLNTLPKQKRAMRRAMRKHRNMLFNRFKEQLMKFNNFFLSSPDRTPPKICLLNNSMRYFYMWCIMVGINKPTYRYGTLR